MTKRQRHPLSPPSAGSGWSLLHMMATGPLRTGLVNMKQQVIALRLAADRHLMDMISHMVDGAEEARVCTWAPLWDDSFAWKGVAAGDVGSTAG